MVMESTATGISEFPRSILTMMLMMMMIYLTNTFIYIYMYIYLIKGDVFAILTQF